MTTREPLTFHPGPDAEPEPVPDDRLASIMADMADLTPDDVGIVAVFVASLKADANPDGPQPGEDQEQRWADMTGDANRKRTAAGPLLDELRGLFREPSKHRDRIAFLKSRLRAMGQL
jgi:hypothetical protein